jgi:dipeptidyl-peptidase 4
MSSGFFRRTTLALTLGATLGAIPAFAQLSQNMQDWMHRLDSGEFSGAAAGGRGAGRAGRGGAGGGRWVDGGKGYTASERGEVVRYDTATGAREVLFTAGQLTPPGFNSPGRPLQGGEASADGKRLLFSTNPRPTMIRKTAYDYWVLDKSDNSWHKLAAQAAGGVLYARLSPDGSHAAYVRDNNLYVEEVRTGAIRQLTADGSPSIINGTSDWVYEEEFSLREGFSWSPDGQKIAYFQFDQSGVPEFALINYTDSLYPVITKYPYPKPGQTNSAVRVGVVNAAGGPTRWVKAPGNPRDIYIPRMDWADNSREVILQHLNRLQNTDTVLLADAETGETRPMYRDQDPAWVNVNNTFEWLENGKRLLYTSERDGWRHAYAISREGEARLITTGAFDLLSIAGIDEPGGWLYYIASPENATQRYLYRSRLDGSGRNQRVTPVDSPGTHTYNLSPNCHWAFHSSSRFDSPGVSDLVRAKTYLTNLAICRILNPWKPPPTTNRKPCKTQSSTSRTQTIA